MSIRSLSALHISIFVNMRLRDRGKARDRDGRKKKREETKQGVSGGDGREEKENKMSDLAKARIHKYNQNLKCG